MARFLAFAAVAPILFFAFQTADAGDYVTNGYQRNVCWPRPYIYPDRAAVVAPFAIMANNGWRRQNLLGDHHFTKDGTQLTTAGKLKVRWILTQAPMNRRSMFVAHTYNKEVDSQRLLAVQGAFGDTTLANTNIIVQHTYIVIEGRSASVVDRINTGFQENSPLPILPVATGGSSSSGGE